MDRKITKTVNINIQTSILTLLLMFLTFAIGIGFGILLDDIQTYLWYGVWSIESDPVYYLPPLPPPC